MKIRFEQSATVYLQCEPGDEIHVANPSQPVRALLAAVRLDGTRVCRLVGEEDGEEVADADHGDVEMAVKVRRGRPPSVPR